MSVYNQDGDIKKFNSYAYQQVPVEETRDDIFNDRTFMCTGFLSLPFIHTDKYIDAIREIEKFTFLKENWDGYGAIPLRKSVAEKSKSFVENLDFNFFENYEFIVKPTPYSTLVIDWYNHDNLFSLEIGDGSIAYFTDGTKLVKEELGIKISSDDELKYAICKVEEDLHQTL